MIKTQLSFLMMLLPLRIQFFQKLTMMLCYYNHCMSVDESGYINDMHTDNWCYPILHQYKNFVFFPSDISKYILSETCKYLTRKPVLLRL